MMKLIYGGKFDNLEYISHHFKDIPIPKSIKFEMNKWKFWETELTQLNKIAKSLGYPLAIRSNYFGEDGLGNSFAGLFHTAIVQFISDLEIAFDNVRTNYSELEINTIDAYCKSRNLPLPTFPIDVFLQKYVDSKAKAIITEHPNIADTYMVDLEWALCEYKPEHKGSIITGKDISKNISEIFNDEDKYERMHQFKDYFTKKLLEDELTLVINHIKKIKSLKRYQGIAHQAEITLIPYSFLQWRPFRKEEYADFNINEVAPGPNNETIFDIPMVLGITTKKGIQALHNALQIKKGIYSNMESLVMCSDNMQHNGMDYAISVGPLKASLMYKGHIINSANIFSLNKSIPTIIFTGFEESFVSHNEFKLLERGSLIAYTPLSPFREWNSGIINYWSDGKIGRVQFLDSN
jgi:hypothetical protein